MGWGGVGALADGGTAWDGASLVGSAICDAAATCGAEGVFADETDLAVAVACARGWGLTASIGATDGVFAASRGCAVGVAGAAGGALGAANARGSGRWVFITDRGVGGAIGVSTTTCGADAVFADEALRAFAVAGAGGRRGLASAVGAFGAGSTSSGGAVGVAGAGVGALGSTAVVVDALGTSSAAADCAIGVATAVSVAWALGGAVDALAVDARSTGTTGFGEAVDAGGAASRALCGFGGALTLWATVSACCTRGDQVATVVVSAQRGALRRGGLASAVVAEGTGSTGGDVAIVGIAATLGALGGWGLASVVVAVSTSSTGGDVALLVEYASGGADLGGATAPYAVTVASASADVALCVSCTRLGASRCGFGGGFGCGFRGGFGAGLGDHFGGCCLGGGFGGSGFLGGLGRVDLLGSFGGRFGRIDLLGGFGGRFGRVDLLGGFGGRFGRIDLLGGFGVGGFGAATAVGAGLTGAKQADLGGGTLGVLFASCTR